MDWKARVPVLAAALWWGSLTAIGFIAVPLLFVYLPEPARMDWGQGALIFVLAGLLLALLLEFAVAPRIVARENLRLWHGMGTGLYALQWACALTVLWKTAFGRSR